MFKFQKITRIKIYKKLNSVSKYMWALCLDLGMLGWNQ